MREILEQLGLGKDEITVYEYLLTNGARVAGDVSRQTAIKRGTAYNVLGDLVAGGFARQFEEKGVMKFALEHPSKIKEIIESQRTKQDEAARAFETALPSLTSRWNLVYHRPAVVSFEGAEGLKKIYESIINDAPPEVMVVRSSLDEGVLSKGYFDAYTKRRVQRGIKTRIISNREVTKELLAEDEQVSRERRIWSTLDVPSEIDIWGDKVALISFDKVIVGTVIDNAAIAESLKKLFDKIWQSLPHPSLPKSSDSPESQSRLS